MKVVCGGAQPGVGSGQGKVGVLKTEFSVNEKDTLEGILGVLLENRMQRPGQWG